MRLIDADKLMHDIRNTITEQSSTIDWLNLINRQPTAYDVDKVAEKLEQKMRRARDKEQENTSEYFEGEADGFEFAIEIVKGGGNS